MPCPLLMDCADVFAPVIARLAKMSLQAGTPPSKPLNSGLTFLKTLPGTTWNTPLWTGFLHMSLLGIHVKKIKKLCIYTRRQYLSSMPVASEGDGRQTRWSCLVCCSDCLELIAWRHAGSCNKTHCFIIIKPKMQPYCEYFNTGEICLGDGLHLVAETVCHCNNAGFDGAAEWCNVPSGGGARQVNAWCTEEH